jgi:RimJ/RimL family protein N-acetyltransferase
MTSPEQPEDGAAFLPDARDLPAIVTPRLRLRALRADDAPALLAIFSDPDVTRYWADPPYTGLADAEALVARVEAQFAARSAFRWGIVWREADAVLGTCSLYALEAAHRRAEVGFALAREAWGRGVASEAVAALVDFAFTTLGLHRIEADVDPRNAASLRTLERLGFRREGYLRERYLVGGEVQDSVLVGLLRADPRGPTAP